MAECVYLYDKYGFIICIGFNEGGAEVGVFTKLGYFPHNAV